MGENIQKCDMHLQACLIREEVSCCGVLFVKIFSVILGKSMACFCIVPMEKQAINFPKILHNA